MRKVVKMSIMIPALLLLVVASFIGYQYYSVHSWGANGKLTLRIANGTVNMSLNDTPTIEYVLANVGDTDLRVFWAYPGLKGQMYYLANNSSVRWVGPIAKPPPDTYYNNDRLIVLKAHESRSETTTISKRSWDITANETYRFLLHYECTASYPRITLPYWKGELWSNELIVTVA
jgi:hypothetical protein